LALKGIGPYTAAAIASFAFDLPYAVVDGNVYRVLSRYFGISVPIDSMDGKIIFSGLAADLLDKTDPAAYNQALMDFGAVVCKPQLPLCQDCVLQKRCIAYKDGTVRQLPVKEKSIKRRTRWFYYLLFDYRGKAYVRKRGAGDIWENLFEFVLIERPESLVTGAFQPLFEMLGQHEFELQDISPSYKQELTHQTIRGQVLRVKIKTPLALNGYELMGKTALQKLPFPKFIANYLKDKNVSLNLF
jgi:A/G-specific adenine glycosylase